MKKARILFVCNHNSGRSQMAEAFLNNIAGDRFEAESAGLEPRNVNPLVVEVMKEKGLDISSQTSDSVFDFFKEGRLYDYVVNVCDRGTEENCPVFPGIRKRMQWPFIDPEKCEGGKEEKLNCVRIIRDDIYKKIKRWLEKQDQ